MSKYAQHADGRIAVIDLSCLPKSVKWYDLERMQDLDLIQRGSQAHAYARNDAEVVIDGAIPLSAIVDVQVFVDRPEGKERSRILESDQTFRNTARAAKRCRVGIEILHDDFKLSGVTHYSAAVDQLVLDQPVILRAEDDNKFDPNAVAVFTVGKTPAQIGYSPVN